MRSFRRHAENLKAQAEPSHKISALDACLGRHFSSLPSFFFLSDVRSAGGAGRCSAGADILPAADGLSAGAAGAQAVEVYGVLAAAPVDFLPVAAVSAAG